MSLRVYLILLTDVGYNLETTRSHYVEPCFKRIRQKLRQGKCLLYQIVIENSRDNVIGKAEERVYFPSLAEPETNNRSTDVGMGQVGGVIVGLVDECSRWVEGEK